MRQERITRKCRPRRRCVAVETPAPLATGSGDGVDALAQQADKLLDRIDVVLRSVDDTD